MFHISTLLALLLEGPYRYAALDLLYHNYTPEEPHYIWSTWEPHIRPPPTYPLAEGTLARGHVLVMLRMDYITPQHAAGDAQALLEFADVAIPSETFTVHTAVTLHEEEMANYPVGRGNRAQASHTVFWEVPGSKPGGLLDGSRTFCPVLGLHVSGPIYYEN